MAIPTKIKQLAHDVRNKIYGRDVRESIAKGMEESGAIADESNERSKNTAVRQDHIEVRYDVVVGELTEESELLDGRVGPDGEIYPNLKARLDNSETVTRTQFSRYEKKLRGIKSILDFEHLVINNGKSNEDWKEAFKAARDFIAGQPLHQKLVFPAGIYQYSESPNWAISDAIIVADGEVRMRYTGTGNAVILDAGKSEGSIWYMTFGKFLIEAPATAKNSLFVRGVHASEIKAKILGAGAEYAGLWTEWCVCTDFYVTTSNRHEPWYQGARPKYGMVLEKREAQAEGLGGFTSWCTFYSPRMEGCQTGIHINRGQGNSFFGGTSEGNLKNGIELTSAAMYNKFFGIDLEVNATYDVYCIGKENEFHSIDSTGVHFFDSTASSNVIFGGSHNQITLGPNTQGNILQNVKYNRFNNGSTINDISKKNTLMTNRNVGLNRTENRPPSNKQVVATGSPFEYTNESGNDERIFVSYDIGTIERISYIHANINVVLDNNNRGQNLTLSPGDKLFVRYTEVPNITVVT